MRPERRETWSEQESKREGGFRERETFRKSENEREITKERERERRLYPQQTE